MKQLIPQSRIDEAATKFEEEAAATVGEAFIVGAQFALKEIQSLMVEFEEFCSSIERNRLTGLYWFNLKHITTQQLLEKFIEFKNK